MEPALQSGEAQCIGALKRANSSSYSARENLTLMIRFRGLRVREHRSNADRGRCAETSAARALNLASAGLLHSDRELMIRSRLP